MVMGESIRIVMDYVAKKKGVEGIKGMIDKINKKSVIFTDEKDIKSNKRYPGYYLARVLKSAVEVLGDEKKVEEMGSYFGSEMNLKFRGFFGSYNPRKSTQYIVIYMRKYLPIFHTGYRSMSENTYWLGVSKLDNIEIPFINGVMTKIFERHGGIKDVKKKISEGKIEYVIKF